MNQPSIKEETVTYRRILEEARPFLGSRAEEFIRRQCFHIAVEPEKLEKSNIGSLAFWVGSSAKLLLPRDQAELLYQKILALGQ